MRWFRNNVDSTLSDFFAVRRRGCAGPRLDRLSRVERALRECVEATAEGVLTDQESSLLDAERQFRPDGAAARVAEPDALLLVLPTFLTDERWCPADAAERRVQLLTVGALTRHLMATLDSAEVDCAVTAIAAALEQAAAGLRSAPGIRSASSSRTPGTPR